MYLCVCVCVCVYVRVCVEGQRQWGGGAEGQRGSGAEWVDAEGQKGQVYPWFVVIESGSEQ